MCKRSSSKGSPMLLLEGTHLLQEILKTDHKPAEIVATPDWIDSHRDIFQIIPEEVCIYTVTPSVLKASLTTSTPDGVASVFSVNALPKLVNEPTFTLALDRLQDPGNLGTLFRTALAADIEEVWLASGADPLGQKVLRASAGAILHLPYERLGPSEEEGLNALLIKLEEAAKNGQQVLATVVPGSKASESVTPYWEIDWMKPTVLVLGNEGAGLHPSLRSCCTHEIWLPHNEAVDSLNVASAAVPLLLERRRAKMTFDMHS